MNVGRVNYGSWFFRVLGWDGLLPVCVFLIPNVIEFLFPNKRGALEITGLLTPPIMLVFRLRIGMRHIATNHCSPGDRGIQFGALLFGILVLGFIDGVLILSHLMPPGTFKDSDIDVGIFLFSVYLGAMTMAMYPGREKSHFDTPSPEEAFDDQEM